MYSTLYHDTTYQEPSAKHGRSCSSLNIARALTDSHLLPLLQGLLRLTRRVLLQRFSSMFQAHTRGGPRGGGRWWDAGWDAAVTHRCEKRSKGVGSNVWAQTLEEEVFLAPGMCLSSRAEVFGIPMTHVAVRLSASACKNMAGTYLFLESSGLGLIKPLLYELNNSSPCSVGQFRGFSKIRCPRPLRSKKSRGDTSASESMIAWPIFGQICTYSM